MLSQVDVKKAIQRAVDQHGAGDLHVGQSNERCLQSRSFQRSGGFVGVRDGQSELLLIAAQLYGQTKPATLNQNA
jgi:hypothetical protein